MTRVNKVYLTSGIILGFVVGFLFLALLVEDWRAYDAHEIDFPVGYYGEEWPKDFAIRIGFHRAYKFPCKAENGGWKTYNMDGNKEDCKKISMSDWYDDFIIKSPYFDIGCDKSDVIDDAKLERSATKTAEAMVFIALLFGIPAMIFVLLQAFNNAPKVSWIVFLVFIAVSTFFQWIAWIIVLGSKMGKYDVCGTTVDFSKGRDDGVALGADAFAGALAVVALAFYVYGHSLEKSGAYDDLDDTTPSHAGPEGGNHQAYHGGDGPTEEWHSAGI